MKIDFQPFIDEHKNDLSSLGKKLIIPKSEIKGHYSGWSVSSSLTNSIEKNFENINFGFNNSIIVLDNGSIISNSTKSNGEIFTFEEVLSFSTKEKGFLSKGEILDKNKKVVGTVIGNDPNKGYEIFKKFQEFIKENETEKKLKKEKKIIEKKQIESNKLFEKNKVSIDINKPLIVNHLKTKGLETLRNLKKDGVSFLNLNGKVWEGLDIYLQKRNYTVELDSNRIRIFKHNTYNFDFNDEIYDDGSVNHRIILQSDEKEKELIFDCKFNKKYEKGDFLVGSRVDDYPKRFGIPSHLEYKYKEYGLLNIWITSLNEFEDLKGGRYEEKYSGKVNMRSFTTTFLTTDYLPQKLIYFMDKLSEGEDINKIKENYNSEIGELNNQKTLLIKKLDKDDNGKVDLVENDDFKKLLKLKQDVLIEFDKSEDKSYLKNFVKLSRYINQKKENIQKLFERLKDDQEVSIHNIERTVWVIENQINTYNLMLLSSISMVYSLIEDDRLTFYEIYESFDKLNIFSSNHEREIMEQLGNIENKLDNIVQSINSMEKSICDELIQLSFVTEGVSDSISYGLSEISSSIDYVSLNTSVKSYKFNTI